MKCTAKIYDIYEERSERSIEEDSLDPSSLASGISEQKIDSYQFDHSQDGAFSSDGFYVSHQKGE